MTDTISETPPPQQQSIPQTNGISDGMDEEDRSKIRPADIDADVKEMERRKRVEVIMNSKMFREELERIIEQQLKEGSGTTGLMQQISDMMGVNKQAGNLFKSSNCVIPINDIRGIEAMGYGKGEKILRCKLAAVFRLIDLYGWTQGTQGLVTARLNQDEEHFLVNPYGMMYHEITASSLIKVAMQGNIIEQGTTNFSVNITAFSLHAAVHAARPDIKCIINVHTPSVVAISALKHGLLPLSQESVVIGDVSTHPYHGGLLDTDEKDKLARNLGPNNKVLLLSNQGALCCGETIEEAFYNARNTVLACESQLKLLPIGIDNLILLNDEQKKKIYDAAHKAPESTPRPDQPSILEGKVERKWRIGGVEFEALMRMLDNAGFRTGYIYRHPLIKGDPPRPKNDVEVPPAVSSLGYLLEEEELYRQGLWKKLEGGKKGHDRSRWLNSPNVYQKVEILETGTPDPKKITKWVSENSPTHTSTPVKIDSALQFVPKGTNPKEFKQKQQQIKDYRRADKISAGPQSHILEGVTWEEARKMQDATVTQTGDQVVLMGAASKGIIQRGHQHNAMVYKSPYAKNPFDSITDEELDEYKKVVEKKTKGEYDTDFSESEGLSSAQINKRDNLRSPTSITSETEEESRDEPQVLRIETKQAPRPSQPEVVLSDGVHMVTEYKKIINNHVNYYRTYSHAGLPKGSYLNPNPQHFHIVQRKEIAQPIRPILIKTGTFKKSSHYLFNRFNINYTHNQHTNVIINIGDIQTVSLSMSLHTLIDFIQPFASILNLLNLPLLRNQACQTTYNTENDESENSSEKEIMEKLHHNLVEDLTKDNNDDIYDFGEIDSVVENESLAQIHDNNNNNKQNSTKFFDSLEISQDIVEKNHTIIDEGFEDVIKSTSIDNEIIEIDENVMKFSKIILDYISEQCFNSKELLVFPELDRDINVDKLLVKLRTIYDEIYENDLNNEQRNELRLSICRYVLDLIDINNFTQQSISDSSDSEISDKLFCITEFLFDLLDKFFNLLNNSETIHHSTPDVNQRKQQNQELVTSFKKDTKKQSESYWFAITSSPVENIEKPKVSRRIINVDEIPLPIPDDLIQRANNELSLDDDKLIVNGAGGGDDCSTKLNDFTYINFNDLDDSGDSIKINKDENYQFIDSVSFYRTSYESKSYLSKTTIMFNHSLEPIDEDFPNHNDDNDEGDWMGYESARF